MAVLHFVGFSSRNDAAIVRFPDRVYRWSVNRKSQILQDALQGVLLVADGHGDHWGLSIRHSASADRHKVRFAVDIGSDQKGRSGIHPPLGRHFDFSHSSHSPLSKTPP